MGKMQFVTVRDFRSSSREIWKRLSEDEEIIITNNGKPTALMVNIPEGAFEETVQLVRQAKFLRSMHELREEASEHGVTSMDEIDAEIQAYRKEKRSIAQAQ
jgi:antitoxin (DNA-binding transcriptional repressor) of toxin-antitoxin stability system